jgi:hypothetical protein
MASIKKRTRTGRRKDVRTGQVREVEVEYWRARYRDDGGKTGSSLGRRAHAARHLARGSSVPMSRRQSKSGHCTT